MLNVRPNLYENELQAHHPLRFTQGCGIDQIIMIGECVYLLAKNNFSELLKTFQYRKKTLLSCSVVTLWLDPFSREKINRFVILTNDSA